MKMYILILEGVPDNFVPVISAHASLACYLKFKNPDMEEWLDRSFKKVVCSANPEDFYFAAAHDNALIITESALNNTNVAVVLAPRKEWPDFIKKLPLWKPTR